MEKWTDRHTSFCISRAPSSYSQKKIMIKIHNMPLVYLVPIDNKSTLTLNLRSSAMEHFSIPRKRGNNAWPESPNPNR